MSETAMHVEIWHNPACGTSRNTLEMIRQSGENPVVIEYLKTPPSRERLVEIRIEHEARHTSPDLLPLMFEAGLQGFPDLPPGTRRVTIQLP